MSRWAHFVVTLMLQAGEPGTLALSRGHWSPHRVTPVEGARERVNAVLSYARAPGHRLHPEIHRLLDGRTPEDGQG